MQTTSDLPPPPNPLNVAYESFKSTTPFVTRGFLSIVGLSWCLSWVLPLETLLSNDPQASGLIYRCLTSPLGRNRLFNLIFAFLTFGKSRIEHRLGSTQLLLLLLSVDLLSNLAFLLPYAIMRSIATLDEDMYPIAAGIWLVLFGVLAVESHLLAEVQATRPFLMFQVPTMYYPVAIFAFFTLMSMNLDLGHLASLLVGYGLAFSGQLPIGDVAWVARCEQSYLQRFRDEPGWIASTAIFNDGAWSQTSDAGMQLPLFSAPSATPQQGSDEQEEERPLVGSIIRNPNESSTKSRASVAVTNREQSGQTLGGSTKQGDAARKARLRALEKRDDR